MRRISDLPDDEAAEALRACCGSAAWVRRMLSQRPFRDRDDVMNSAERIWWDLPREDWLEAFAAHPRIGGSKDGAGVAAAWSAGEQAKVLDAGAEVKALLAEANEQYEQRFGHIFIVCASGKRAEEILDICLTRLENAPELEIRVAAAEQARITQLRLDKLLAIGS